MQTKRKAVCLIATMMATGAFMAGATALIPASHLATNSHTLTRAVAVNSATTSALPSGTYFD